MKKLFVLFLFVFASLNSLSAQHDLKINALGVVTGNYGGAYEFVLNEKSGINLVGAYYTSPKFLDRWFDISFTGTGLTTEYRYYFMKSKRSASGIWAAPYVKYSRHKYKGIPIVDANLDSLNVDIGKTDIIANKFALGFSVGAKKVTDYNLIYGFYMGFGWNLISLKSFSNPDITEIQKTLISKGDVGFQYRLGFNVGYRFGE